MKQHPNPGLAAPYESEEEHVSLCELLDRVLNKGVVVRGDIVISVADVDLLYLGVQLVLSATETARQAGILLPHDMTRTIDKVKQAQLPANAGPRGRRGSPEGS